MTKLYALIISFFISDALICQSYKFRKYAEQDGLNNRFIYTLDQDELGNLMIGTGEGLYTYDGFTFSEVSVKQGLNDNFLTCSTTGSNGTVWYGHNEGLLTKYQFQKFEHFDISAYTHSRINGLFEDNQGNLWILTQNDGVIKKTPDGKYFRYNKGIEEFNLYSFAIDKFGNIWLGTDIGLIKARATQDDALEFDWVGDIIETKVSCLLIDGNYIYAGTDDYGIFKVSTSETGAQADPVLFKGQSLQDYSVNSIFIDQDKSIWLCTNNDGLVQITNPLENNFQKLIHYREKEDSKSASVRICKTDREGTMWIGTIGEGLLKLTDDFFSIHSYADPRSSNDVYSIFEQNDSIWCGTNGKIYLSLGEPVNVVDSIDQSAGLTPYPVTSIHRDGQKKIWIGNCNGELKVLEPQGKKMKLIPLGTEQQQQQINDIQSYQDIVYVATDYGLYLFRDLELIAHLTIQSGLPHNVIKSLYSDSQGRMWISSRNSQLTYIQNGEIKNISVTFDNMLLQINCITEDNLGNIWIGTIGHGVIKKTSADEISVFNKNNGLYSDYCYSMVCDQRNKLWIGHHGALSKINILNNEVEVVDPGTDNQISFLDNSVKELSSGVLLFGINQGVLKYDLQKDQKNGQQPILHFTGIQINDKSQYDYTGIALPYGEYKFKFDFLGVSLKNPNKVTYQYYLEGYESDWSEVTNSSIQDYSKLSHGEYTFKVKCFNSDGFGGSEILQYKIIIDKPFWLKWWFIAGSILALALLTRYLILRRERNLREAQERLKSALDERTREVVEQKELLEEKNKDIMDSIQYARNIQNAILPSNDALNKFFAEALVYYKPRDIVSGDFYWVEQFEQTVVVSCADCTGHGVPGAFMSLIGSTLLKEVSSKKSVQCSSDVLVHLDNELNRMLRKQLDGAINDGMDIAVFDYNTDTRAIKIASANRPVILFHKNEWHELRGDRKSIGGKSHVETKDFTQYEFIIEPGDMIYLFSDGITDQFGGKDNKKLKRSGLMAWLKDIKHLSMQEQREIIKQNFKQWKGDREQLDDIILIGIRF